MRPGVKAGLARELGALRRDALGILAIRLVDLLGRLARASR